MLSRGWGSAFNHPFLTLKERDVETGLDYFLAGYYSSTQGRFTSTDPLLASGHRDLNTTEIYTHVELQDLKDAIESAAHKP